MDRRALRRAARRGHADRQALAPRHARVAAGRLELGELGPLLRRVAGALEELLAPEQLYVALWSHSGGVPVHIHPGRSSPSSPCVPAG